jgi:hypothetical protein
VPEHPYCSIKRVAMTVVLYHVHRCSAPDYIFPFHFCYFNGIFLVDLSVSSQFFPIKGFFHK